MNDKAMAQRLGLALATLAVCAVWQDPKIEADWTKAQKEFEGSKWDACIATLTDLLSRSREGRFYALRAHCFLKKDNRINAGVDEALKLGGADGRAWIVRGHILIRERRAHEAADAFTQAISGDPTNPEAYFGRAGALVAAGDWETALRDLEEAARLHPKILEDPAFHSAKVEALAGADRTDEALKACADWISRAPNDVEPVLKRADLYMASGEYKEAFKEYQRALKIDSSNLRAKEGKEAADEAAKGGGTPRAARGSALYQRTKGRTRANRLGGGDGSTDTMVENALRWLARHQSPNGSWEADGYVQKCGAEAAYPGECKPNPGVNSFDVGISGLAMLAFLGMGLNPLDGGHWASGTMQKGLEFLLKEQDASGRVGSDQIPKYMYNHHIAASALIEAAMLSGSPKFRAAAQKALDYTVQSQNPGSGWRYGYRDGQSDSSVTVWAVQVLKAADAAGLRAPKSAIEGAIAWYDKVTDPKLKHVGYTDTRAGKVVIPGVNEEFENHPALTAAGIVTRMFAGQDRGDDRVVAGMAMVHADRPDVGERGLKADLYYWYVGSQAVFQVHGPSSAEWGGWFSAAKEALAELQSGGRECRHGSWEPTERWSSEGGRVHTTALGALILQTPYRYPSGAR